MRVPESVINYGQGPVEATPNNAAGRPYLAMTVSAGTAFKIGFYGAFGVLVAMLVPWFILFVVIGAGIASLHR